MKEKFDIAADLRKIARLLEIKGENPFKTQAYERGARALENHQGDFDALVKTGRLKEIPGQVPALTNLPQGCSFAPRCAFADERCRSFFPPYEQKRPGHWAACWHSEKLYG